MFQPDGEWLVGAALNTWILRRDMKRALKKRILFTRSDRPGLFQSKVLKPVQLQHRLASSEIRQKWNVKVFLNLVPEEEALRLYSTVTGSRLMAVRSEHLIRLYQSQHLRGSVDIRVEADNAVAAACTALTAAAGDPDDGTEERRYRLLGGRSISIRA